MSRSWIWSGCFIGWSFLVSANSQAAPSFAQRLPWVSCQAEASESAPAVSWAIGYDGATLESHPPAYNTKLELKGRAYHGSFSFDGGRYGFGKIASIPISHFSGHDNQSGSEIYMNGICVTHDRRKISCAVQIEGTGLPVFSTQLNCFSPEGKTLNYLSQIDVPSSDISMTLLRRLNELPDDRSLMNWYGCDTDCPEYLEAARTRYREKIARDIAEFLHGADVYVENAADLLVEVMKALPEGERYRFKLIRENQNLDLRKKR